MKNNTIHQGLGARAKAMLSTSCADLESSLGCSLLNGSLSIELIDALYFASRGKTQLAIIGKYRRKLKRQERQR